MEPSGNRFLLSIHSTKTGIQFAIRVLKKVPDWYANQGIFRRIIVLVLVSLLIARKTSLFLVREIYPSLDKLEKMVTGNGEMFYPINTLIYFDVFVLIVFALLIVVVFSYLLERFPVPFNGHPVITFFTITPLICAFLFLTPTLIANVILSFSGQQNIFANIFDIHPLYFKEIIYASLCFGLSIADRTVTSGGLRWWSYLFLLLPPLNRFPILWWNGASGLFQSGYWMIWRVVLTFLVCVKVLVAFPFAQPIRNVIPLNEGTPRQVLDGCTAYQVKRIPQTQDFFIRCGFSTGGYFARYHREKTGEWILQRRSSSLSFPWNEGAYDFPQNRLYLFNTTSPAIEIYSLSTFDLIERTPVNISDADRWNYNHFVALDDNQNILSLVSNNGCFFQFDIEKKEVVRQGVLDNGIIWGVFTNSVADELLILQGRRLTAYKLPTFEPNRFLDLPGDGYGLKKAPFSGKIYISLPRQMQIAVIDEKTFKIIAFNDAPAGVRNIEFDEKRGLLFLGAISGVVEVWRSDDLEYVGRIRLPPWIHWMKALDEYAELVITLGEVDAVVWQYEPFSVKTTIFDLLLEESEKVARRILRSKTAPE